MNPGNSQKQGLFILLICINSQNEYNVRNREAALRPVPVENKGLAVFYTPFFYGDRPRPTLLSVKSNDKNDLFGKV